MFVLRIQPPDGLLKISNAHLNSHFPILSFLIDFSFFFDQQTTKSKIIKYAFMFTFSIWLLHKHVLHSFPKLLSSEKAFSRWRMSSHICWSWSAASNILLTAVLTQVIAENKRCLGRGGGNGGDSKTVSGAMAVDKSNCFVWGGGE